MKKLILLFIIVIIMTGCKTEQEEQVTHEKDDAINLESSLGKQMVAESYIIMLKNKDLISILEILPPNSLGKDLTFYDMPFMTIAEAEGKGLLKDGDNFARSEAQMAEQITIQHDIVEASFGAAAWDNVTYTIQKKENVTERIGYIDKSTNKEITERQYEELNRVYWESVAQDHGLTFDQLFSCCAPYPETQLAYEYGTIQWDNAEGMPTTPKSFPGYDVYIVNLAFNNETVSEDLTGNFRFSISDQSGTWQVQQGIVWSDPLGGALIKGNHKKAEMLVEVGYEHHTDIPGLYRHDIVLPKISDSVLNGDIINEQIERSYIFPDIWSDDDYRPQPGWGYTWNKINYDLSNINGICSLNILSETTSAYIPHNPSQSITSFYYDENKGVVLSESQYLEKLGYSEEYILDRFNEIYGEKYKGLSYGFKEMLYYINNNGELTFYTTDVDGLLS